MTEQWKTITIWIQINLNINTKKKLLTISAESVTKTIIKFNDDDT